MQWGGFEKRHTKIEKHTREEKKKKKKLRVAGGSGGDRHPNKTKEKKRSSTKEKAWQPAATLSFFHTSSTALMQPSFSGLLVTWAYLPHTTLPPGVTRPSSDTLTSMTVPLVTTPSCV